MLAEKDNIANEKKNPAYISNVNNMCSCENVNISMCHALK